MGKPALKDPNKLADTGAYSAAIECDGWLYMSGHASIDLKTGRVISGTIGQETERTLALIAELLNEAGCAFEDVVKCTCHWARMEDFDDFNRAYARCFPGTLPARTTVQSVLWGGLKVEIEAIARDTAKQASTNTLTCKTPETRMCPSG